MTVVSTLLFLMMVGTGHESHTRVPLLIVQGSGEVRVAPDMASIRLGITRQEGKASSAQEEVNKVANKIQKAALSSGIPQVNIQTAELSVHPIYSNRRSDPEDIPRVVAYRATNDVVIRVYRLDHLGKTIDAVMKAGANTVHGISFGLRDDSKHRQEALKRAVLEAAEKARAIAQAMQVRLAGVVEVREGGAVISPRPLARMALAESASTPVSPGQLAVGASVTVHYGIEP